MLSKKHFKAIAEIISNPAADATFDHDGCMGSVLILYKAQVAIMLADYFASENPNFDREKFLRACGIK